MDSAGLTITSVKRIQGRVDLLLSNEEILSMPRALLKERAYRSGMPFDVAAFEALVRDRSYPYALDKAVSLLACRARTERELTEALRKNMYPGPVIARVMARLHESGYINDNDFADQWATSRAAKGMGTRRIRMELYQKGVAEEAIDEVISSLPERELLEGAIKAAQKAARGKNLTLLADRQKVLAALARRGYDFSISKRALQQIIEQQE